MLLKSSLRRTALGIGILSLAGALSVQTGSNAAPSSKDEGQKDRTSDPRYVHPYIAGHGGIVELPDAVEKPREGSKVVLDMKQARLDRAALITNQYAHAGFKAPEQFKVAVILHGDATKASLSDEAYARHTGNPKNPYTDLLKKLKEAGVEVLVCGQALAHHRYGIGEVNPDVQIAASAATVNINKQMDGYAYIPFH